MPGTLARVYFPAFAAASEVRSVTLFHSRVRLPLHYVHPAQRRVRRRHHVLDHHRPRSPHRGLSQPCSTVRAAVGPHSDGLSSVLPQSVHTRKDEVSSLMLPDVLEFFTNSP